MSLCGPPGVGPIPLVGLTLTWFAWVENSTSHYLPTVNLEGNDVDNSVNRAVKDTLSGVDN